MPTRKKILMKLPEEITILGRTYLVLPTTPINSREGTFGFADYVGGVIYLDFSVEPSLLLNILWHEMYHIIQQDIQGEMSEEEARLVGVFVNSVLMENPSILECYADFLIEAEDALKEEDE
jgi:hypothetical protein